MRRAASALAAVFLAVAPLTAASAASIGRAQIEDILKQEGYSVEEYKSNMLVVSVGDQQVLVAVTGADGDVSYITYLQGLSKRDVALSFLTKFNSEVKFGRAYVDRDGDVTLQMDRNSSGGVTLSNIKSDFEVFLLLISKFLSDLESQPSA
ncbi:MAG TPA: YbjN domain-containing protein [Parvularculaceae bacterium]|nr:YbjN domain-containing protein [Parvularculaceae bacterium]